MMHGTACQRLLFFLALVCGAIVLPQASRADKRAFVVGTNNYVSVPVLGTALKDAGATSQALREIGFATTLVTDATLSDFDEKWREFLASLKSGDIVLFYFAGHGLQVDGANYLLLKDAPKVDGSDAGDEAILEKSLNFHEIMQQLEVRKLAASIYILDACRNSPFESKSAKSKLGQARGLARVESVYGAFIMYSAGPGEEALDYLTDPRTESNSVYTRRLLSLLKSIDLSLVDVAKRVQVQVEEDARSVKHQQRPAYFDGILGQYYVSRPDAPGKPLDPSDRIAGENVVRVGAFASWDSACQSRPAPRVNVTSTLRYGRVLTRYETFTVAARHFGNPCDKSTQRGIGVYYIIDDAYKDSPEIENLKFDVKHWSVAPATTVNEQFNIDLATKYSKRIPPKN
jgi:hypothetical protein